MSRPYRVPKSLLIAGALVLAAPLVASAQFAGPHVESGLWQSDMEVSGFKIGTQICMDGSEAASRRAFRPPSRDQAKAAADRECEKQDIHPIPGGYSVNSTCTDRGRVTHVSGKVTGDFRTRYAMDMTVDSDGRPSQTMHMESHRLGECPAGMKPGEVRTQFGGGPGGAGGVDIAAAIAAARARSGQ